MDEVFIWLRVGDSGDYSRFRNLEELIGSNWLESFEAGSRVDGWRRGGMFVTPCYQGNNYVSLYHGDAAGNLLESLDRGEEMWVEKVFEDRKS